MTDSIVAFVLVQSKLGKAFDVVKLLSKVNGVNWACAVTGPYDVITCVEVPDTTFLSELVTTKIPSIEGIERTHTAIVMAGDRSSVLR